MFLRIGVPLLVALALAGGVWFIKGKRVPAQEETIEKVQIEAKDENITIPKAAKETIDDSLEKDVTEIEAELKILESDEYKVDQGLNDKQIPIGE